MASRDLIHLRNAEIRALWTYLRKTERRTPDFVLAYMRKNYFLEPSQVYNIVNNEHGSLGIEITEPSEAFKRYFYPNNERTDV